jgi:hypothetical protein
MAQVPASSMRTGQTSERKNKFATTPDFPGARKWNRTLFFQGRLTLTDARMIMAPRVQREGVYRKFPEYAMAR